MQYAKASYLVVVTMQTFDWIAFDHIQMLYEIYVENDDTTWKHIFGYHDYYSLKP